MPSTTIHLNLPIWIQEKVDFSLIYPTDETRMALAIQLAKQNIAQGSGGPFGAAIFNDSGQLIAVGVNQVVAQHCSVAHAEMLAFIHAQAQLKRFRLNQEGEKFILATSAQPCCMCYGASFWAGIDEILIGARAEDVTALTEFDEGPLPLDWIGELESRGIRVKRDILRDTASAILKQYSQSGGNPY